MSVRTPNAKVTPSKTKISTLRQWKEATVKYGADDDYRCCCFRNCKYFKSTPPAMVLCDGKNCENWIHRECNNMLRINVAHKTVYCLKCSIANDGEPNQISILDQEPPNYHNAYDSEVKTESEVESEAESNPDPTPTHTHTHSHTHSHSHPRVDEDEDPEEDDDVADEDVYQVESDEDYEEGVSRRRRRNHTRAKRKAVPPKRKRDNDNASIPQSKRQKLNNGVKTATIVDAVTISMDALPALEEVSTETYENIDTLIPAIKAYSSQFTEENSPFPQLVSDTREIEKLKYLIATLEIENIKVSELKEICKEYTLKMKGRKAELVKRIQSKRNELLVASRLKIHILLESNPILHTTLQNLYNQFLPTEAVRPAVIPLEPLEQERDETEPLEPLEADQDEDQEDDDEETVMEEDLEPKVEVEPQLAVKEEEEEEEEDVEDSEDESDDDIEIIRPPVGIRRPFFSNRNVIPKPPSLDIEHPSLPVDKNISELLPTANICTGSCEVCWEHDVQLVGIPASCDHPPKYCLSCLKEHIQQVITGKGNTNITCLEPNCGKTIPCDEFFPIIDSRPKTIMDRLLLHKCLESNKEFRWCRNPNGCGAGQLISNCQNLRGFYSCHACHARLCFRHSIVWHRGMTCEDYDLIRNLDNNFSSRMTMLQNTKQCPQCRSPIERLEGCSVMTCCRHGTHGCQRNERNARDNDKTGCDHGGTPFCGHRFCWECLGEITITANGAYQRHCRQTCRFYG